eukprot:tig00000254_g22531.t1
MAANLAPAPAPANLADALQQLQQACLFLGNQLPQAVNLAALANVPAQLEAIMERLDDMRDDIIGMRNEMRNVKRRLDKLHNATCGDGAAYGYEPVENDHGDLPPAALRITSRQQLMELDNPRLNQLLQFYGLAANGDIEARRRRLIRYLGLRCTY